MSSFAPTADIPIIITSPSTSSERRITPSWTVGQLKQKLEFVTGIPPSSQRLEWKAPGSGGHGVFMDGQEDTEVGLWGLVKGGEIEIHDSRSAALRAATSIPTDPSTTNVEKYTLPTQTYESLPNTVLHWKKTQKLGRFDPTAKTPAQIAAERLRKDTADVEERGISEGKRCEVGGDGSGSGSATVRRGVVRFLGPVKDLPGGGIWVGVELDEPVGKNDGSVKGRRLFVCEGQGGLRGVVVRPERVRVGDFEPLGVDDDLDLEEEEEI